MNDGCTPPRTSSTRWVPTSTARLVTACDERRRHRAQDFDLPSRKRKRCARRAEINDIVRQDWRATALHHDGRGARARAAARRSVTTPRRDAHTCASSRESGSIAGLRRHASIGEGRCGPIDVKIITRAHNRRAHRADDAPAEDDVARRCTVVAPPPPGERRQRRSLPAPSDDHVFGAAIAGRHRGPACGVARRTAGRVPLSCPMDRSTRARFAGDDVGVACRAAARAVLAHSTRSPRTTDGGPPTVPSSLNRQGRMHGFMLICKDKPAAAVRASADPICLIVASRKTAVPLGGTPR